MFSITRRFSQPVRDLVPLGAEFADTIFVTKPHIVVKSFDSFRRSDKVPQANGNQCTALHQFHALKLTFPKWLAVLC